MSYPTAWRKDRRDAKAGGGSQPGGLPLPANDNRPPIDPYRPPRPQGIPSPANDNVPPGNGSPARTSWNALPKIPPWVRRLPIGRGIDLIEHLAPFAFPNPMNPIVIGQTGWQLSYTCSFDGFPVHRFSGGFSTGNPGCLNFQFVTGIEVTSAIPSTWRYLNLWNDFPVADGRRSRSTRSYHRAGTGGQGWLRQYPNGWVTYQPRSLPSPHIDPQVWPVNQPAQTPKPIPRWMIPGRVPNPYRSPAERTDFGPAPVRSPTAGVRWVVGESTRPSPAQLPRQPPGKGEKEKKFMLAIDGATPAGQIANVLGETQDWAEAFYEALPEDLRKQLERDGEVDKVKTRQRGYSRKPQDMMWAVWNHWDKLDWSKVIQNIAWNQLEDAAYGRLGKVVGKANRARGAPAGITLGPAL